MYPKSDVKYKLPSLVVQALQAADGSAHYKSNNEEVYRLLGEIKDLDRPIGFARRALKDAGFVTNDKGTWTLTDKGRRSESVNVDEVWEAYGKNRPRRMKSGARNKRSEI